MRGFQRKRCETRYSVVLVGPPQGPVQNLSFIEWFMTWKRYYKCKGGHEIRTISEVTVN